MQEARDARSAMDSVVICFDYLLSGGRWRYYLLFRFAERYERNLLVGLTDGGANCVAFAHGCAGDTHSKLFEDLVRYRRVSRNILCTLTSRPLS